MSNPWAQSFDDLRSPYLQEKKAKKDYDGDGKIESGAKEYRGVVHNKIQKAKGGKADGQDTSSVKEEKYDDKKVSMRFGDKKQKERKEKLEKKRGMKLGKHPQFESKAMKSFLDKKAKMLEKKKKKQSAPYKNNPAFGDDSHHSNKKTRMEHHQKDANGDPVEHGDGTPSNVDETITLNLGDYGSRNTKGSAYHTAKSKGFDKKIYKAGGGLGANFLPLVNSYEPEGEIIDEEDKKGKGSGKKDACYHKVKAGASVWPSAYASGRLVQCRKVGAANYGKSKTKKESLEIVIPMKSFGDMVGECWKTHKQEGMKKKGNRMVPNCVPKNEEFVGEEGINKDPAFDIMRPGGKNSPYNKDGTPKENPKNFKLPGEKGRMEYLKTLNMGEAVKNPKLDIKETGVKNKIEINPEIKTEAAKAPVKK